MEQAPDGEAADSVVESNYVKAGESECPPEKKGTFDEAGSGDPMPATDLLWLWPYENQDSHLTEPISERRAYLEREVMPALLPVRQHVSS